MPPDQRPVPNTNDLQYLRKRKLELDAAFGEGGDDDTPVPEGELLIGEDIAARMSVEGLASQ